MPVLLLFVFLIVAFTVVSVISDFTVTDFFTFWLAGRMTLQGQDIYSETSWIAAHHFYGSTWMPNPIFPYPIALSLFLIPLGALPLKTAYFVWIFLSQVLLLLSVFLLLDAWKDKERATTGYFLVITMLLFRPIMVTLFTAQFVAFFLVLSSLTIYFWKKENWFLGGLIIALLNFKPSYGALILVLVGIWLLFEKQKMAIWGIIIGNLILGFVGLLQNPRWIQLFWETGKRKSGQTFGLYPTMWSGLNLMCKKNGICIAIAGGAIILLLLSLYIYLLYSNRNLRLDSLNVMALVIPIALLVTYNWAYDQTMLVIPITFCVSFLATNHKQWSKLFPILVDLVSLSLLIWAYFRKIDIWSLLLPAGLLVIVFWFWVTTPKQALVTQGIES